VTQWRGRARSALLCVSTRGCDVQPARSSLWEREPALWCPALRSMGAVRLRFGLGSRVCPSLPVALPQSMPPDSKWGEERTVLSRLVEYKERRDVYFGPSAQEVLMREKMQRRQTSDVTTAELMAAVVVVERGQTEQAEALARLGCQVADVLQLLHGPRDRNGKERIDGDGGAGEGGRDGDGAFTA